jgi:small subunit ribosomal protein S16
MLAIRLARFGTKKKPAYRVVVAEKSRARDSKSLETLGHYNPTKDPIVLALNEERIQYWIELGAQPSETVRRLMTLKPEDVVTTEQRPRIEPAPRAAAPPATDEQPATTAEAPPATDEGPAAEARSDAAEQSETQAEAPAEEPSDSQGEVKGEEESQPAAVAETAAEAPADESSADDKPSEAEEATAEEKPDSKTEPTS